MQKEQLKKSGEKSPDLDPRKTVCEEKKSFEELKMFCFH